MAIVGGGENLASHNLRHFLRIKDGDSRNNLNPSTSSNSDLGRHNHDGLTLNAILSQKRSPPPPPSQADDPPLQRAQSSRTLFDIIREDQSLGVGGDRRDGRRRWRQLREKIRLHGRGRGGGSSWSSTLSIPASDLLVNNDDNYSHRAMLMMTRRPSSRFDPIVDLGESTQIGPGPGLTIGRFEHGGSLSRATSEDNLHHHNAGEEVERRPAAAVVQEDDGLSEQPVRMSLMALLAESDRQMGLEGSGYVVDEEAEEKESAAGGEYNGCCVCMVRHKGAAFIPCGHTFCRLCSRELWVRRGNCPLCNNYIQEILDIF
ncbi:hypothetical protein OROGR_024730 [Orobanche gracilis]